MNRPPKHNRLRHFSVPPAPSPAPAVDANPLTPPRVKITVKVSEKHGMSSVHYTGPGEAMTLCGIENETAPHPVVKCVPTEDKIACTKCERLVAEAKARPGFGSPEHRAALERGLALSALGLAGITGRGTIVDRREHPEGLPIPANSMLNVPKPRKLLPKLPPGVHGSPDATGVFEVGSNPEGETDCDKRGINHLMQPQLEGDAVCISPDCNAHC